MSSRSERKRWFSRWGRSPAVILVLCSLAYVGIKAVEVLLTYPASWGLDWRAWLNLGGMVLALFWYAMFVLAAKELAWFGRWRRPVEGLVLCAAVTGIAGGTPHRTKR